MRTRKNLSVIQTIECFHQLEKKKKITQKKDKKGVRRSNAKKNGTGRTFVTRERGLGWELKGQGWEKRIKGVS